MRFASISRSRSLRLTNEALYCWGLPIHFFRLGCHFSATALHKTSFAGFTISILLYWLFMQIKMEWSGSSSTLPPDVACIFSRFLGGRGGSFFSAIIFCLFSNISFLFSCIIACLDISTPSMEHSYSHTFASVSFLLRGSCIISTFGRCLPSLHELLLYRYSSPLSE